MPDAPSDRPEPRFVELGTLEHLIGLAEKHQAEMEWLLNQQSTLRTEYLNFFKRDIKEIADNIHNLLGGDSKTGGSSDRANQLLMEVIRVFRGDIETSMRLVDAALQKLSDDQDDEKDDEAEGSS